MKKLFILILLASTLTACKTKKEVTETNNTTAYAFVIPAAFTPNGDGQNDEACFVTSAQKTVIKGTLQIYNRWGQEIWQTENLSECWSGIDPKTQKAYSSGVYMVMIKQDGVEKLSGAVTLLM